MVYTWNINPVVFSVFGLEVRWYGLVYVFGFFFSVLVAKKLFQKINFKIDDKVLENLAFGAFFSGVIGGRLGDFVFYSFPLLWQKPTEIFKVWHGGMSIHGGLIAAILFLIYFCRKHKLPLLTILDIFAVPFAVVLGFGRIANFINGELVGVPTDQTWGVIFPHVDNLMRHPSQLYEATKNFFLFGVLFTLFKKEYWRTPGLLSSVMILGYGVLRFSIEFFREPDGMVWIFSKGQFLCLFMIVIGFSLLMYKLKSHRKNE